MGQITVFGGPERRRRWREDERAKILSEAFSPGACVARIARQYDVSTALVYTWRRKAEMQAAASPAEVGFVEAVVLDEAGGNPHGRKPQSGFRCDSNTARPGGDAAAFESS